MFTRFLAIPIQPLILVFSSLFILLNPLFVWPQSSNENLQIPSVVQGQLNSYQDRFQQILSDECPNGLCTATGCEVLQFATLDQLQDASLPGLETPRDSSPAPQYQLTHVRCDFAHEASLSNSALASLKQRLQMKIKTAGTQFSLAARKLSPRALELTMMVSTPTPQPSPLSKPNLSTWETLSPWMFFLCLMTLLALILLWGYRRLGHPQWTNPVTSDSLSPALLSNKTLAPPEPTAPMVMARIQELKEKLKSSGGTALKPFLKDRDRDNLCRVLKYFGAEALSGFSKQVEYDEVLNDLRVAYQKETLNESNSEIWTFLDQMERLLIAHEIKINERSTTEDAAFLKSLAPDEFFNLMQTVSEEDLPLFLSLTPPHLQNAFFRRLDTDQSMALLEKINRTSQTPDKVVREKLLALRKLFELHREDLRQTTLDRLPLLEQLISSLPSTQRMQLWRQLKAENSNLAKELLTRIFVDEGLLHIPAEILNDVFLKLGPERSATYLQSLPFADKIIQRLNQTLAQSIRRWYTPLPSWKNHLDLNLQNRETFIETEEGHQPSSNEPFRALEATRQEIALTLRDFSQQGRLNLSEINQSLFKEARP